MKLKNKIKKLKLMRKEKLNKIEIIENKIIKLNLKNINGFTVITN